MLTALSLRLYAPERSWTIELLAAEEQTGAAQVRLSTRLATSGEVYENTYVYFFRFADGKIAEVWEHLDTAYAFALFDRALSANSAPSPVDLIKKHFESKRRCDQVELNEEIAEDVRWWPPASAERKGIVSRPIEGRATMVAHLATEMYEEAGRTWTITHIFGDGNLVCARARLQAQVAATGDEYDNEYSYIFRVEKRPDRGGVGGLRHRLRLREAARRARRQHMNATESARRLEGKVAIVTPLSSAGAALSDSNVSVYLKEYVKGDAAAGRSVHKGYG